MRGKDPGTRNNIREDLERQLATLAGVQGGSWRAVWNGVGEPGMDRTTQECLLRVGFCLGQMEAHGRL